MLYTIENENLALTVTDMGGTMTSIKYLATGEERLWQGNEFWNSRDVVIFPIIGHAGSFVANGKEYLLKSHGVVRYSQLALKEKTKNSVTLYLESNEETLKNYPYEFEFTVKYELIGNSVKTEYSVKSKKGKMPFYVGGHPGMYAPNGEAVIEFGNEESPVIYPLNGDVALKMDKLTSFIANKAFFAECKTFQLGSLSGGKIFASTQDGFRYSYKSDCPIVAFWSNEKGGDYICVEPWWGINDYLSAPKEITLKPFMNFVGEEWKSFNYTLTVEKFN